MSAIRDYQLSLAEAARDHGMRGATAVADPAWVEEADAAIRQLAASGQMFTAEDLRAWVGEPTSPNAIGALFSAAARAGIIERVGYRPSTRLQRHGGVMGVWRGAR